MAKYFLLVALVVGCVASKSVTLTEETFASETRATDTAVLFFAPWCGHCQRLLPTWKTIAAKVQGKAKVAEVDCTVDSELCGAFNVMGYPTIIFFGKDGKHHPFQADRTEDALINFILSSSEASVEKLF